jgi:hypothetical protein
MFIFLSITKFPLYHVHVSSNLNHNFQRLLTSDRVSLLRHYFIRRQKQKLHNSDLLNTKGVILIS